MKYLFRIRASQDCLCLPCQFCSPAPRPLLALMPGPFPNNNEKKKTKSLLPFARPLENKPDELGPPDASQQRNTLHKMRDGGVPVVARNLCVRNFVDHEREQPMSQIAPPPPPAAPLPRQAICCCFPVSSQQDASLHRLSSTATPVNSNLPKAPQSQTPYLDRKSIFLFLVG